MLIFLNLAFERKPSLCKGGGTTEGGGRIVNEDYNLIFAITITRRITIRTANVIIQPIIIPPINFLL